MTRDEPASAGLVVSAEGRTTPRAHAVEVSLLSETQRACAQHGGSWRLIPVLDQARLLTAAELRQLEPCLAPSALGTSCRAVARRRSAAEVAATLRSVWAHAAVDDERAANAVDWEGDAAGRVRQRDQALHVLDGRDKVDGVAALRQAATAQLARQAVRLARCRADGPLGHLDPRRPGLGMRTAVSCQEFVEPEVAGLDVPLALRVVRGAEGVLIA